MVWIWYMKGTMDSMSQPHFEGVWGWHSHSRNVDLGSSGTLEYSKLNCRGQNTLSWGVFYTVGKVSKFKCRKWPCMSHSDIYSISYGQKKGRKSNWQFDSRPLKVKNQPDPGVCRWNVTHHWKSLEESYKFTSDFIPIRGLSWELRAPKVPRI